MGKQGDFDYKLPRCNFDELFLFFVFGFSTLLHCSLSKLVCLTNLSE